eukprot:2586660-Rhodomonas_salina.3
MPCPAPTAALPMTLASLAVQGHHCQNCSNNTQQHATTRSNSFRAPQTAFPHQGPTPQSPSPPAASQLDAARLDQYRTARHYASGAVCTVTINIS